MERLVIVAYKPFPGKEVQLLELALRHVDVLRNEGLVSERRPIIMQAKDGTIVEVFGWKSKESVEIAHNNPQVQKLWSHYAEVCEYVPIGTIAEGGQLFAEFTPVN